MPVNVTLLFSTDQYKAAADAYMKGLERRVDAGLSADVRSVASLFVSRWDVAVIDKVPAELRNTLGMAVGKQAYKAYRDILESDRFQRLENVGARAAAAAVRQHRHQGQERVRHAVYRRPRRAEHGEHDAGRTRCWPSPITARPASALPRDGGDCEAVLAAHIKAGIDLTALAAQAAIRRRQGLRQVLARTARRDRSKSKVLA